MRRLKLYAKHGRRLASCVQSSDDTIVREGLAYSVADMARLTDRGMPVNSLNTSKVCYEGEENPSFFVTQDRERYVDVCDLWEQDCIRRDKARAAYKASKRKKS